MTLVSILLALLLNKSHRLTPFTVRLYFFRSLIFACFATPVHPDHWIQFSFFSLRLVLVPISLTSKSIILFPPFPFSLFHFTSSPPLALQASQPLTIMLHLLLVFQQYSVTSLFFSNNQTPLYDIIPPQTPPFSPLPFFPVATAAAAPAPVSPRPWHSPHATPIRPVPRRRRLRASSTDWGPGGLSPPRLQR